MMFFFGLASADGLAGCGLTSISCVAFVTFSTSLLDKSDLIWYLVMQITWNKTSGILIANCVHTIFFLLFPFDWPNCRTTVFEKYNRFWSCLMMVFYFIWCLHRMAQKNPGTSCEPTTGKTLLICFENLINASLLSMHYLCKHLLSVSSWKTN